MTNWTTLPHEKLIAYQVARELLVLVSQTRISNPGLRDQALRAARSACLNIAEAAGRQGAADKARVYAIARGEACEAAAALDIGAAGGDCSAQAARRSRFGRGRLAPSSSSFSSSFWFSFSTGCR